VRMLAARGPKLITSNLGHVRDVTFKVKEEMGFTSQEIVSLLLGSPRIWTESKLLPTSFSILKLFGRTNQIYMFYVVCFFRNRPNCSVEEV